MAVSDKPWSGFSQADYTVEQWRHACLIDTGEGDANNKGRYRLPVLEPEGTVNRAGVHAASAVLAGGRGGDNATTAQKSSAARRLVGYYRNDLKEEPPESLTSLANRSASQIAEERERIFTPVPVEIRAATGGISSSRTIGGYAAVFNRMSDNLGGFLEKVTPSFFNNARANGWPGVVCRYNHDDNMLLGASRNGTLRLGVDDTGLAYEVDLPQSREDVREWVQRGDVGHSSFAFIVPPGGDEWGLSEQGYPVRSLVSAGVLIDTAPVPVPAYRDTSVGMRSLARCMGASLDEVRKMAESDELRKFFVRSDRPSAAKKPTFGPAARMAILAKKAPH